MSNKSPVLTSDEVEALAKRSELGDILARQHLVTANLRLVVSIAKTYVVTAKRLKSCWVLEDLIQEGSIGLIKAVNAYQWRRDEAFSTYATACIQNAIMAALRGTSTRSGNLLRLPEKLGRHRSKVYAATKQLALAGVEHPTSSQIAQLAGITATAVTEIRNYESISISSLSQYGEAGLGWAREPEENSRFKPLVRDASPEDVALQSVLAGRVRWMLNQLDRRGLIDRRSIQAVRLRFGFDDNISRSNVEIAKRYKVRREVVAQWQKQVISLLLEHWGDELATLAAIDLGPAIPSPLDHEGGSRRPVSLPLCA